jgi:hypothetical protein
MTLSRRFVLRGMGATVALPVLPSLLSSREAKAAPGDVRPCFVSFSTNHGGIWAKNMFPTAPAQGVVTQSYAGRVSRRFPLTAARSNGTATVSPVLSAPDTKLTDALVAKMFTVQGFGVPFYLAHNTGGALGNYSRCDGNGADAVATQTAAQRPTIDQIMGWSTSFYPDLSGVRQRVMVVNGRASYNYANPETRTGALQENTGINSPNELFDALFPQAGGPSPRRPIVDKVLEAYQNLRASPRLSTADKSRLDEHLQRLSEVQRRLSTTVSCTNVGRPTNPMMSRTIGDIMYGQSTALDPAAQAQYLQAINDVIVLALSCGVSRIAVNRIDFNFSDYSGDWHQDVVHQSDQKDGVKQTILYQALQRVFANVIVDLASKLNAVDMGSGSTLLDQTLLSWVQESGNQTHDSTTIPVVGFGSAQGFLKTGSHLDYRNLELPFSTAETDARYPGLVWNQWLGTVLQAMRVPKSEWEKPAVNGGYPDYNLQKLDWVNVTAAQAWPPAVWAVAGEVPPWLKA